jgi:RNA polymerase sigma factor (sigma-70 family)
VFAVSEKRDVQETQPRRFADYFEILQRHLPMLFAFVGRELRFLHNVGALQGTEISTRDVVDEVCATALRRWDGKPDYLDVESWLKKLAVQVLRTYVPPRPERQAESIEQIVPKEDMATLDFDSEIYEFYEPDEELKLEDLIPDINARSPEEVVTQSEFETWLYGLLRSLPAEDRDSFAFHYIEGRPASEVARMMGLTAQEVKQRAERTRQYLLSRIDEYDPELRRTAEARALPARRPEIFAPEEVPEGYVEDLHARLTMVWHEMEGERTAGEEQ